jgi:hypothetical protein
LQLDDALLSTLQPWLKSVAALVALTSNPATHDREDSMQSQSTEFGVGGKVSDASHVDPVVGQPRAMVLVIL